MSAAPAPLDVFISYSSADKAVADAACGVMEARGVRCWIAPRDITPGEEWSAGIMRGLERCRVMVLVFSGKANESPQVRREVERAVNKGLTVIPFRIENVVPTGGMEYFLSAPHWLDAYAPPLDDHLDRLAGTVAAHLASLPPPASPPSKGVPGLVHKAGRAMLARDNRARVLVGLVLAVLLSVGLYFVAGLLLKDPKADDETIAAKAEAEQLAGRVAALDRGQGFGERIDAVGVTVRTAAAAFDQKKFADALTGYRAAGTQARDLLAEDDRRTRDRLAEQDRIEKAKLALDKARAEADEARKLADKARIDGAEAKATDQPGWAGAVEMAEQAAADFRAGEFARAAKLWADATAGFNRAAGGKALKSAKDKFEAELARVDVPQMQKLTPGLWTPVNAQKAAAEAAEAAGNLGLAATIYTAAYPLARAATLPMRRYAAFWLGMYGSSPFEEHRRPFGDNERRALGLADEILRPLAARAVRLSKERDEYLVTKLPRLLDESHEPDVSHSYLAGYHVAMGRSHSAGMAAVFAGALEERFESVADAVGKAVVRMNKAGWPPAASRLFAKLRERTFDQSDRWTGGPNPKPVDLEELAHQRQTTWGKPYENAIQSLESPDTAIPLLVAPPRPAGTETAIERWANVRLVGCRLDTAFRVVALEMTGRQAIRDANLAALGAAPSIESVRLGYTFISGTGLKNLSGLTNLTELHAPSAGLTDNDGPAVAPFKKLRVLVVGRTGVGDKFAEALTELKELRELDLSNTAVTDAALSHLAKLPNLVRVDVTGTKVTKKGATQFETARPMVLLLR